MFSFWGTFLLYNIVLLLCLVLCRLSKKNNKRFFLITAYIILTFVSLIRYDIGADYENYYADIQELVKDINSNLSFFSYIKYSIREPFLFFLTSVFSFFPGTIWLVFSAYFLVFIYYVFKVLDKYDVHLGGILCLFLSTMLFQSWDWIRQAVSMAIGIYAITFLEKGNMRKFVILILFSFLFHFSSLVFLILLLFKNLKKVTKYLPYILVLLFILGQMGRFDNIYETLLVITPFYGEHYSKSIQYATLEFYTFKTLPYIYYSVWIVFLSFYSKNLSVHPIWKISLFIGGALFIVSGGSLLIDRLSFYFMGVQLVLFPIIISQKFKPFKRWILLLVLFASFTFLNRRYFVYGELRGCVPYQTVFSPEYQNNQFRYKD